MKAYRLTTDEEIQLTKRLYTLIGEIEKLMDEIEDGLPREKVVQTLRYLSGALDTWRKAAEEDR